MKRDSIALRHTSTPFILSLIVLMTVFALSALSCQKAVFGDTGAEPASQHSPNEDTSAGQADGIRMLISPIVFDDRTKATMHVDEETGLVYTWEEGDAAGVYSTEGGFARFGLVSGEYTRNGRFDGSGFSLNEGATYYAFAPYDASAASMTTIRLRYAGQSVSGDNDTVSPMERDYVTASSTVEDGNALFRFSHVGAFLRLTAAGLPTGAKVSSVSLVPMMGRVPGEAYLNLVSGDITLSAETLSFRIACKDLFVPDSGKVTVWATMPPVNFKRDHFAVLFDTDNGLFSFYHKGSPFGPGKAYRWEHESYPADGEGWFGFSSVTDKDAIDITSTVDAGEYSGITYLGGNRYALVHDKLSGGGIVYYDIEMDDEGAVLSVNKTVPAGTESSAVSGLDNEGVAYVPSTGTLFVSSESEQSIKEYDLDGYPTGRKLAVPDDMAPGAITSNKGFEALTYNKETGLFWTTTESPLSVDTFLPRVLRLQGFGNDLLPSGRYLYVTDAPGKSEAEASAASSYVFGVPALAALPDGRILVLEREVYVPNGSTLTKAFNSLTTTKIYAVNPFEDEAGILRKTLVHSFTTTPLSYFANYEGMCLGPVLPDGSQTVLLVPDSQNGSGGLTREYIKVLLLK